MYHYYNTVGQRDGHFRDPHYDFPRRHSVAILTDSIFKYVNLEPIGSTHQYRGHDLVDLVLKQRNHHLPSWRNVDLLFIQAGTNDIANRQGKFVHRRMQTLVQMIQRENPYIKIIICGILPRPCDLLSSKGSRKGSRNGTVQTVNRVLKIWCKGTEGVHFWPAYRTLIDYGIINMGFFAVDRLHLSYEGTKRMERIIKTLVARFHNEEIPFHIQY